MRKSYWRQLGVLFATLISAGLLSGCEATNPVYRNYYQDSTCHFFYVDYQGNRVYVGRGSALDDVGRGMLHRDANGRLYWVDSFGNRFYKSRVCR